MSLKQSWQRSQECVCVCVWCARETEDVWHCRGITDGHFQPVNLTKSQYTHFTKQKLDSLCFQYMCSVSKPKCDWESV